MTNTEIKKRNQHWPIWALLGFTLGCLITPKSSQIETVNHLPDQSGIILNITQIKGRRGIYIVDAVTGEFKEWRLQGPNLLKDDAGYCGTGRTMSWSEPLQQLFYAGSLACEEGFYFIHADGFVERLDLPSEVSIRLRDKGHTRSSNGKWIALVDPTENSLGEHVENIYMIEIQDMESSQITDFSSGYINHISWKEEDDQLLFGYSAIDGQIDTLYRVNRDGSDLTVLLDHLSDISFIRMKWSPDGRYAAYTISNATIPATLHLLDINTGEDTALLPPHSSGNPRRGIIDFTWSPDGQQIAFNAGFDGTCSTGYSIF